MAELACPYVGLAPYTVGDARFFFGRERETRRLVDRLRGARLTLLYGASGVGKSSLLRAGVSAALAEAGGEDRGGRPEQVAVYLDDWQGDPLRRLREAVRETLPGAALPPAAEAADLADFLRSVARRQRVELVVLLDQLEEYFVYHGSSGAHEPFARQLAAAIARPDVPASFLVAIRDDALSRLDRFAELIPELYANRFRLEPLGLEAAREAVVQPVRAYNAMAPEERKYGDVEIEPAFVDAVIDQVRTIRRPAGDVGEGRSAEGSDGIEPPCLQLVMTRIWHHEIETGSRTLWRGTLEELGGTAAIVRGHLDRTLEALAAEEREILTRTLPHLVTPSGVKKACTVTDLVGPAEVSAERLEALLARLAGSEMRLLAALPPSPAADGARYEICHDYLAPAMLHWRRRYQEEKTRHELAAEANRQRAELEDERRATRRLRWLAAALAAAAVLVAGSFAFFEMRASSNSELGGTPTAPRERQVRRLEEDRDAARAEAARLEDRLSEANARILRLQGKIGTHTQQLRQLEEERDAALADAASAGEQLAQADARSVALRETLDDLKVALEIGEIDPETDAGALVQQRLQQLESEKDLLFEHLARERVRRGGAGGAAPPAPRRGIGESTIEELREYLDRDPYGTFAELARRRIGSFEGMALISKAVEHLGGSAVVDDVHSVDSRARGLYFRTQRDAVGRLLVTSADILYLELDAPPTKVIQVVNGDEGFSSVDGAVEEIPPGELQKQLMPLIENPVALLQKRTEEGFFAVAVGRGEVAGHAVELVEVESEGRMFRLSVDPESGRIWSLAFAGEDGEGNFGAYEKIYSDHRMADDKMEVPFATVISFDGETVFDLEFEVIKIDGLLDGRPLEAMEGAGAP